MIETMHTPGPWRVGERRELDPGLPEIAIHATPLGRHYIPAVALPCSAGVSGRDLMPETTEANARLIAAAPAYFDGVQKMLLNEDRGGDGWWEGWEMLKAAHAEATAEGRSA